MDMIQGASKGWISPLAKNSISLAGHRSLEAVFALTARHVSKQWASRPRYGVETIFQCIMLYDALHIDSMAPGSKYHNHAAT